MEADGKQAEKSGQVYSGFPLKISHRKIEIGENAGIEQGVMFGIPQKEFSCPGENKQRKDK